MPDKEGACAEAARDLEEVRRIVTAALRGYRARIYLFGSWAAAGAGRASDIDVAVLPLEPIPQYVFCEIRETLEESNVLFPAELADLSCAPENFRERVLGERVAWND